MDSRNPLKVDKTALRIFALCQDCQIFIKKIFFNCGFTWLLIDFQQCENCDNLGFIY